MQILNDRFQELQNLAAERRRRLEDNKRLCQFFLDVAELEQGFKEMAKVLSSPDIGHDVTSIHLLLSKHKVCIFSSKIRNSFAM